MKLPWDKKYICWGITVFVTVAASVLFFMILQRWDIVMWGAGIFAKSLRPITYGLILAYLLNPLLNGIEGMIVAPILKKVCKKSKKDSAGIERGASIVLTWLVVILFIYALVSLVGPEIRSSVETLIRDMPGYANHVIEWFSEIFDKNPGIINFLEAQINGIETGIEDIISRVQDIIPNVEVIVKEVFSSVYGIVVAVLNILIGIIVSIYVLKDKEKFIAQIKKILYSVLTAKKANGVISVSRLTHEKFGNFITGKIFDSIIIGIMCFIILSIVNMPYSALVSVVVGVTNVIPFFGPFIGAIPSALLILCEDPIMCLWFVVIIFLLQQFDGNILGPKILGSTTGVSSFWVLFSILIGSGLFGVWGMICAVPMFAVIYTLVGNYCRRSLKKKGMDYSSQSFERIDHIDENTMAPVWSDKK